MQNIDGCKKEEIEHALFYMYNSGFVLENCGELSLNIDVDQEFNEYVKDLISYGLTRYLIDFGDASDF